MTLDLSRISAILQLPLPENATGFESAPVRGVNILALAAATDLCFAERDDQFDAVASSAAAAFIVPESFPELPERILLRAPRPREAFFRISEHFVPASEISGIHPSAQIDPRAQLGADVSVGPCAVIGAGVHVGAGSVIGPGCYLGPNVEIGTGCVIEANVTVHWSCELGDRCVVHSGAVIGGDGFGFHWDGSGHRKVPQVGRVVIEDDCEIGSNTCVDRATLGETRIRRGTKIDNLVQVAHNTDIGEHVILVSQCGVAGSSTLGTGTIISGQVAVSDHVNVGAGARVGGQSGVTKDIPAGATVFGTPARPIKDTMRELAAVAQLPALLKEVKRQAQELEALRRRLDSELPESSE